MRSAVRITWSLFFFCVGDALAQPLTVRGYVTDAQTGEALIGAHVYETRQRAGTITNAYGFFSLTLPVDTAFIQVSYLGYRRETLVLQAPLTRTRTIELTPSTVGLDSLNVVASRLEERLEERVQMSKVDVSMADVQTLPALLGEADVLKTLQLMPGVQSGAEGSSGLYVRGGSPDQTLVLLDDATVYNVSHLFGFLSTFNTDALNNVELFKGGFPARYGGRLSSVLDLRMREGNRKEFEGRGAVGLVASSLTVEGPIRKEKSSFIVSTRRTYLDLITRPFQTLRNGEENSVTGYYFYDVNAKSNATLSEKDRVFVSLYAGNDRLYSFFDDKEVGYPDKTHFGWRNVTATLRWNRILTPRMFANAMLLFSRFRYEARDRYASQLLIDDRTARESFESRFSSGIQDWSAKIDIDYLPHRAHYVRFGGVTMHHRFTPGAQLYREKNSLETVPDTTIARKDEKFAVEWFAYAEDAIDLTRRLKVNAGVHVSGFHVDDRVYASVQPRLATSFLLPGQWALKASYASMRQYIHLLSNSGIGLPTDLWLPSTARVRPQRSWQGAVGLARTLGPNAYDVSVEGYYKSMDGVTEFAEGSNFVGLNRDWENRIVSGRGWSYGAEMFVRKKKGRTRGWIGYTLSWTKRRIAALNQGRAFPYRYDRRHDLSIAIMRKLKRRTVSATWVYGTGNAVTLPVAQYSENGEIVNVYNRRNGYRMAAYHRLDVSVHTPRRDGKDQLTFSIYNLYSRRNPFFLFVKDSSSFHPQVGFFDQVRTVRQVSLFPIIPSISYRFTF